MKPKKTYQEQDSINNQNIDTLIVPTLELLEIEDEADLIVPVKVNKVRHKRVVEESNENQEIEQYDSLFTQGFDKIPTRKVKNTYTESVEEESEIVAFSPSENNKLNTTWQTILLLIAFGLLGFVKAFSSSRFKQIVKSVFSYHAAEEVVREEKVFFHRVNFSLFLLYVIASTLLIVSIATFYFSINVTSIFYIKTAGFVVAAYALKFIISFFTSLVFENHSLVNNYIYSVLLFNYLFGVLLLPSLMLIYFSIIPFDIVVTYIILPSLFLSLILRLFRLVLIGKQNNFLISYIILYICTLEILPLVVLSKIFIFK